MTALKRHASSWVAQPIEGHEEMPNRDNLQDIDSIHNCPYSSGEDDEITRKSASNRRRQSAESAQQRNAHRSSAGGPASHEATHLSRIDAFLRGSGLRLKSDGTCNFLFESRRFVIETTDESGDFLFYASLGRLAELRKYHPDKNILRTLAYWNEVQSKRGGETGLLRIDSSKPDGPHVSFIFYGKVEEIPSAKEFQKLLDRFVDDAIQFFYKLNPSYEMDKSRMSSSQSVSSKTHKSLSSSITLNAPGSGNSSGTSSSVNQSAPSSGNSTLPQTARSVFKMIKSLRSKSPENSIGSMAFVDPANAACPFVVEKNAKKAGSFHYDDQQRKGSSFHNDDRPHRKGSSFHVDDRPHRKGSSFHNDEHSQRKSKSFHVDEPSQRRVPYHSDTHAHRRRDSSSSDEGSQLSNSSTDSRKGNFNSSGEKFTHSEPSGLTRGASSRNAAPRARNGSTIYDKSGNRRKTLTDLEAPRMDRRSTGRERRLHLSESRAHNHHHSLPPQPSTHRGPSKWSMEQPFEDDESESSWEDEPRTRHGRLARERRTQASARAP